MAFLVALSVLVLAAAQPALAQDIPGLVPSYTTSVSGNAAHPAVDSSPAQFDSGIYMAEEGSGGVCLKIRAYVFALNDDHAPKFVRETTCPNIRPRTKAAINPRPKAGPQLEDATFR